MRRRTSSISPRSVLKESKISTPDEKSSGSRSTPSQMPKDRAPTIAHYQVPATVSATELLDRGSDRQFRGLVQDLLTVARRLELARDYFGRLINVTGPQYHLLMTVAQLQGASGISVGKVAQVMHVSSAFVTAETGKLSTLGLLKKRPNPQDRRGALLSLTQVGRLKMDRLIPEIRAVNGLFFGKLDTRSFRELCVDAAALVQGFCDAMGPTEKAEEESH